MPPGYGYGAYSGLAGALDGLGTFLRGQREHQDRERQDARQAELDKQTAIQQRIGLALARGQMHAAGIREGQAPGAGFAVPGLAPDGMSGAPVTVEDRDRYSGLGDGFYRDRNATPEFQRAQDKRQADTTAANAIEQRNLLIGQALQNPNPRDALRRLMSAGVSADDAPKLLEAANPSAKAPVAGTEAYYAMKEREAQIGAKYRAGSGGAGGAGAPIGPNGQPLTDSTELMKWRGEFGKLTGTEREVAQGYSRLRAASAKGVEKMTAADDIALLFGYMKMQDPGSAVRETEYATAEKAAGVPEQVIQLFNKARDGQKLSPEMRRKFLTTAEQLAKEADNRVRRVATDMVPLMTRRGVDPSEVVTAPFSGMLRQNSGPPAGNAGTGRETNMQDELALAREALRDGTPYADVAKMFKVRTGQELPR